MKLWSWRSRENTSLSAEQSKCWMMQLFKNSVLENKIRIAPIEFSLFSVNTSCNNLSIAHTCALAEDYFVASFLISTVTCVDWLQEWPEPSERKMSSARACVCLMDKLLHELFAEERKNEIDEMRDFACSHKLFKQLHHQVLALLSAQRHVFTHS